MPAFIDLTGKTFGRWTVIRRSENNKHNQPTWEAVCECGNRKTIRGGNLTTGISKSCGCLNKDVHRAMCIDRNTTHGLTRSSEHTTWTNMKSRCENPNASGFHKYGAKGIKVCERWQSFENFLADMGKKPTPAHTLDRINPLGDYSPENCRWATQKQQQNNRSNNHMIEFKGKRMTLAQWADHIGKDPNTIHNRINAGLPIDVVLSPIRHNRGNRLPRP